MIPDRPTLADLAANPALAAEVDLDHIPERLHEIERLRAIVGGLARNATDDDDEGDPAVVYEPIRSGYVLIRRDHLATVTSLEHERWKRAHPSSAGRWALGRSPSHGYGSFSLSNRVR